jgi:hypothetical protein
MGKIKKVLSDDGVPLKSGLEVYAEIEVADGIMILVPITMQDNYGNAHKILRRDLGNKPVDTE